MYVDPFGRFDALWAGRPFHPFRKGNASGTQVAPQAPLPLAATIQSPVEALMTTRLSWAICMVSADSLLGRRKCIVTYALARVSEEMATVSIRDEIILDTLCKLRIALRRLF